MTPRLGLIILAAFATPALAWASSPIEAENLLQGLPNGFKIAAQSSQGTLDTTEMIPQQETLDDWSTMITTQVYHGLKIRADELQAGLGQQFSQACPGAESQKLLADRANGYEYSLWSHQCPLNPGTGKPEHMYMKAWEGNDALYVVQYAFRYAPSNDDITGAATYLTKVMVCDSRVADRACPPVTSPSQ